VFGHKWEPAEGTIAEARIDQIAVPGKSGLHPVHVYAVDVRRADGQVMRATVHGPGGAFQPAVGSTVRLEVSAKTGEVRFDHSSLRPGIATAIKLAQELKAANLTGTPAVDPSAAQSVNISVSGTAAAGQPGMRVVGGAEAKEMMRELFSGNQADRAAAIEKLKQVRADMITGQAGSGAMPGQAAPAQDYGTCDPVGPADAGPAQPSTQVPGTLGPEATQGIFGPQATPGSHVPGTLPPQSTPAGFGQQAVPDAQVPGTMRPPAPGGSFGQPGTPGTPGSFGAPSQPGTFGGTGPASKEGRIAKLAALRDQGVLSQQDFEAQRQKILDEF
jgi:Short C-terminal domain